MANRKIPSGFLRDYRTTYGGCEPKQRGFDDEEIRAIHDLQEKFIPLLEQFESNLKKLHKDDARAGEILKQVIDDVRAKLS